MKIAFEITPEVVNVLGYIASNSLTVSRMYRLDRGFDAVSTIQSMYYQFNSSIELNSVIKLIERKPMGLINPKHPTVELSEIEIDELTTYLNFIIEWKKLPNEQKRTATI